MDRNDWVFVGMRLLGLYFAAYALFGIWSSFVDVAFGAPKDLGLIASISVRALTKLGLQLGIGFVLFLGAPTIDRWLDAKEQRMLDRSASRGTSK